MSKGSKRRTEDYDKIINNWDDINWTNKKTEDKQAKAPPIENVLKNPFGNDITYYEDRN